MNKTTISISERLRGELMKLGKKGETYEDIIWKIMTKTK